VYCGFYLLLVAFQDYRGLFARHCSLSLVLRRVILPYFDRASVMQLLHTHTVTVSGVFVFVIHFLCLISIELCRHKQRPILYERQLTVRFDCNSFFHRNDCICLYPGLAATKQIHVRSRCVLPVCIPLWFWLVNGLLVCHCYGLASKCSVNRCPAAHSYTSSASPSAGSVGPRNSWMVTAQSHPSRVQVCAIAYHA